MMPNAERRAKKPYPRLHERLAGSRQTKPGSRSVLTQIHSGLVAIKRDMRLWIR